MGKGFYCSVKAERNAVYGSIFRQSDCHQEGTYNSAGGADKHRLYVVGKCWLEGLDLLTGHDGKTGNAIFASAVCQLFQFRNLGFFKTKYQGAVFLALMFLMHVGSNISNLGSQWIYLLEGLLDLGAAAVLVFEKNVKAFFGK